MMEEVDFGGLDTASGKAYGIVLYDLEFVDVCVCEVG